jgi:hypothetical protein
MYNVAYLLFRYEDFEARGGMRDLVSVFNSKEDMYDVINSIINSSEFDSDTEHLHFYDVEENATFDIKTKKSFEVLQKEKQKSTPSLGEMSGLADLKKEMR